MLYRRRRQRRGTPGTEGDHGSDLGFCSLILQADLPQLHRRRTDDHSTVDGRPSLAICDLPCATQRTRAPLDGGPLHRGGGSGRRGGDDSAWLALGCSCQDSGEDEGEPGDFLGRRCAVDRQGCTCRRVRHPGGRRVAVRPSLGHVAIADPSVAAVFTAGSTAVLLSAACDPVGLDPRGAELIRLGENAIFRLPQERVVVRIARSPDRWAIAAKEVGVSRWLASLDFPVARLVDGIEQPRTANGHPVTYWTLIDEPREASSQDIGAVLHRLHELPPPDDPRLPCLDPFDRMPGRLAAATALPEEDRVFLGERLEVLRAWFQEVTASLPSVVVHGDAHSGNVVRDAADRLVVLDLERFSVGPRDWDLSLNAMSRYSFGWWSEEEYAAFVKAYGYDVTEDPLYPMWRDAHELQMTTWLAQRYTESDRIAAEVRERIACLREPERPRRWHGY